MIRWLVKFNQKFNGAVSTSYVNIETQLPFIRDALDAFERVGYVNARVLAIKMLREEEEGAYDAQA
jgi:hypothetical protein